MPETLKSIYLIYGDDFQVEESLRRLKKRVAAGAEARLDVKEFDGDTTTAAEAVQAAGTLPLFAEKHLVIFRQADKMSAADQKIMAGYAADPNPATTMVLTAEKIAKTNQLYKMIEKVGSAHEFRAPKSADLINWVGREFRELDKRIDANSARHLIETVGTDQNTLRQEIHKLAVYAGEQDAVDEHDIEAVATANPESNIFEMVDALGQKQTDTALRAFNRLLGAGEPPQRILFMIVRQFRIIIKAKALAEKRLGAGEVAAVLGVRPFLIEKYRQQAQRFSLAELKEIYGWLKDADVAMKTGRQEPALALELLIGKVTS